MKYSHCSRLRKTKEKKWDLPLKKKRKSHRLKQSEKFSSLID